MSEQEPASPNQLSPEQQEFLKYLEYAKDVLKNFGVQDLSTSEGVQLRKILEELLPQWRKNEQELDKLHKEVERKRALGEDFSQVQDRYAHLDEISFRRPGAEAAMRWLFELYGVLWQDIPRSCTISDKTTGKRFNFRLPANKNIHEIYKEKFRKKLTELKSRGHDVESDDYDIDPDFIEWLARERDKAHNPKMETWYPPKKSEK